MNLRKLSSAALTAAMAVGLSAGVAFAQQDNGNRQDNSAQQDMRNAGHETKDAAKDTGHGIDNGTHKAYHKTKYHTKKAWHSTKHHTKDAAHDVHNTVDPDNNNPR